MHFCFVIQGFLHDRRNTVIAGPLVQTYLIGRELVRRGVRVTYISLTSGADRVERESHEGIDVIYVPVPRLPMRMDEPATFPRLKRLLRELRPDVIYTRGRSSLPYAVMRYASGSGAVAVWNAARDRDFDGDDYVRMKISAHSNLRRPLARLSYTATMRWLFERGVRGTHVRIVQNRDQIRQFSDRFDSVPILIYSAVEMPDSLPSVRERRDFEVLWVASIKGEKRPELFLDLARRFAGEPIRFVMAGSVLDSRYAEDIRLTAQANERFAYLGPIPYEQTAALFAHASLFVNTSRPGVEGFPNSFLQAWAAGAPVLSIDCDPGGVIARHGLGRIASDYEIEDAVRGYVERPDMLAADRERCFDYARTTHSVESHVRQLIAAIDRAKAEKGAVSSYTGGPIR